MKPIGWICALVGLCVAGCQRKAILTEADATPPPWVYRTAAPAEPILAPSGTFYVLVTVRKETKEGVSRLTPGTEVKLIRPGLYDTPIGPMALKPEMLTNDLSKANAARTSDRAGQAQAYPKSVGAAPVKVSDSPARPVETMASARGGAQSASADERLRAIHFRLSVLKREEARLAENSDYLWNRISNPAHMTHSAPTGLNGSTAPGEVHAVDEKLAKVRAEIQALEASLPKTGE